MVGQRRVEIVKGRDERVLGLLFHCSFDNDNVSARHDGIKTAREAQNQRPREQQAPRVKDKMRQEPRRAGVQIIQ